MLDKIKNILPVASSFLGGITGAAAATTNPQPEVKKVGISSGLNFDNLASPSNEKIGRNTKGRLTNGGQRRGSRVKS